MLALGLLIAIWRVTRLLVRDEFPPVRATRDWIIRTFADVDPDGNLGPSRRWGAPGCALAYLWTCMWCMSVWVGASIVAVADWRLSVPYPWLIIAGGSALSGLANMVEVEHDQRYALRQWQIKKMEDQR